MSRRLTPLARTLIVIAISAILVLLATFARGQTPAEIRIVVLPGEFTPGGGAQDSQIRTAMDEVTAMWTAASIGRTRFTYQLGPRTLIQRNPGECNNGWAGDAAQRAQAAGLSWDKAIFVQQYDNLCRYGGEASIGGGQAFENSGNNVFVYEHELGHMIGLPHSWGVFFVGVFGDFGNAQLKEYGHRTDVMSGGDTVAAMWRYRLGWLTPQRIPRDGQWHRVHLEPITQRQDAFVIQREDGLEWWGERRTTGQAAETLDVTSTYGGVPTWAAAPGVGETVDDPVGGVTIRSLGGGDYSVRGYPPTFIPPVVVQPTPGPIQNTPTPGPEECWTFKPFIRCSPTPAATETPTQSPTPTATEASVFTPTPAVNPDLTPTTVETEAPTETPTPEPTSTPAPSATPVPPPSTVPGIPRPRGGCLGMNVFGIVLIGGGFAWWRRRLRS